MEQPNAREENKTFLMGIGVVTALEVLVWLFFYWIHLQIRP